MSPYEGSTDRWTERRSSAAARRRDDSRDHASIRPTDRYRDRPARDRLPVRSRETREDRYSGRSEYRSGDKRPGARFRGDFWDRNRGSGRASDRYSGRRDDTRSRQNRVENSEPDGARIRSTREPFEERKHGGEHHGGFIDGERRRTLEKSEEKHEPVLASGSANTRGRGHEDWVSGSFEKGGAGNGAQRNGAGGLFSSSDESSRGGRSSKSNGNDKCSDPAKGTLRSNSPRKQERHNASDASAGFSHEGDRDLRGQCSSGSHREGGGSPGRRRSESSRRGNFRPGDHDEGILPGDDFCRLPSLYGPKKPSVGTSARASGILGDISRTATSSNRSELGHGSKDDVEEEQLPSHLLGKKPDFKTAGSGVAQGLKFVSDREEDPHRLCQRQKQIDFGKNTVGYDEYIRAVPIHNRRKGDPVTPDKKEKMSKRRWAGRIRSWRRQLHAYDKKAPLYETPSMPLDYSESKESGDTTASPSPPSPRESKGGAKDYLQQQQEDEDEVKEREQLNAGIYDAEGVLDEFGLNDDIAGDGVIKRKRREPSATSHPLDMQDSSSEKENDDDVEGYGQRRVVKRRRRAWNGWGMSTVKGNRLKLAQGELLEGDEQSPPEGQDMEEGRDAVETSGTKSDELAMEEEDEVRPKGGEEVRDAARQSGTVAHGPGRDLTAQEVECGKAVVGVADDGANKASDGVEADWDNVDFSDDDLL